MPETALLHFFLAIRRSMASFLIIVAGADMSQNPLITPAQEYDTLRTELNDSKKYVFERPLVIVGVGLGLLTAEPGMAYSVVLPALLAGLLVFNFWFTINRLGSAARIVAYIQVVLEKGGTWCGWETSLRAYRIWIKEQPDAARIVEQELEEADAAIPDALMYYPPIYQMHIALIVLCVAAGVLLTINAPHTLNLVAASALLGFAATFARSCWKSRPQAMRSLIERNVIIWTHALSQTEPIPAAANVPASNTNRGAA
jgi:hypothetical protein